jgi:uncharacterized protein YneR
LLMTAAELFGNAHLKWFAENGKHHHLSLRGFGVACCACVPREKSGKAKHDVDVYHVGSDDCSWWSTRGVLHFR